MLLCYRHRCMCPRLYKYFKIIQLRKNIVLQKFTLKKMTDKLNEIVIEKTSHMSTQVGVQLPKLKKVGNNEPTKMKLPKLKRI